MSNPTSNERFTDAQLAQQLRLLAEVAEPEEATTMRAAAERLSGRSAPETSPRPGELEQLRRIDRAARAYVDAPPGLSDRAREELHNALFDGRQSVQETTDCPEKTAASQTGSADTAGANEGSIPSGAASSGKASEQQTDEKGRPMTYWGGLDPKASTDLWVFREVCRSCGVRKVAGAAHWSQCELAPGQSVLNGRTEP